MKLKVSIIIPIYNTEMYLDECITSVINQTYKNIEILLINDGSTDSSLAICKKYKKLDNRIKIINIKHSGVSKTRNKGLESSTGQYIMFLDSDDYYSNDYVEKMYNAITKNKCDIVISGFNLFSTKKSIKLEYIKEDRILDFNSILNDIIETSHFNSISKTIIKKSVIDDNNIEFDTSLNYFEDYKFSFTVMKNSKRIMYLSKCLYNYRLNEKSSTQNLNIEKTLRWFYDEVNVIDYIHLNTNFDGVNYLKFTKLCIMLRMLLKIKNITFSKFKECAYKITEKFYIEVPKEKINIKNVSIINKLRMKLILNNHFRLFYYITKIEKLILNIIR